MLLSLILELAPILIAATPVRSADGMPQSTATLAKPAPDRPARRVPIDGWTDLDARCRVLTTFRSSGSGCAVGLRVGGVGYFHVSGGFFQTPAFERYMRYTGNSPTPSGTSWSVTVLDQARSNVYYLDLGPGVAMWPTRQLQIHIEAGAMMGVVHSVASLALPTRDADRFALGAFAGVGFNFRIPSWPWAFGFDYRIQGIPYGGFSSGEEVTASNVQVGHSLFGVVHSFGLSATIRIEHDGTN